MGVTTQKDVRRFSDTASEDLKNSKLPPVWDVADFFENVLTSYNRGEDDDLDADDALARSIIPAGSGALRDFSYIAPEIPLFKHENCTGCMTCVTECPDTAILAKVIEEPVLEEKLLEVDGSADVAYLRDQFANTNKF
ncbi:MAG TPA: hypothetical protein EYQ31_14570, partial [Candidatus Handelsmanbacteria bacterium]|nr:hypothetical protein [Candidatus Handelsmanbacteria bacterium]